MPSKIKIIKKRIKKDLLKYEKREIENYLIDIYMPFINLLSDSINIIKKKSIPGQEERILLIKEIIDKIDKHHKIKKIILKNFDMYTEHFVISREFKELYKYLKRIKKL